MFQGTLEIKARDSTLILGPLNRHWVPGAHHRHVLQEKWAVRALEEDFRESAISFTYTHLFNTNFIESLCFNIVSDTIIQTHTCKRKNPIFALHTMYKKRWTILKLCRCYEYWLVQVCGASIQQGYQNLYRKIRQAYQRKRPSCWVHWKIKIMNCKAQRSWVWLRHKVQGSGAECWEMMLEL